MKLSPIATAAVGRVAAWAGAAGRVDSAPRVVSAAANAAMRAGRRFRDIIDLLAIHRGGGIGRTPRDTGGVNATGRNQRCGRGADGLASALVRLVRRAGRPRCGAGTTASTADRSGRSGPGRPGSARPR